ncbi:MAG: FAD binding domain-containing protein, partial [Burkholderiales bacterium]|nr:FAD binding domain-containing protein [Burkholderiales bacterium]
MPDHPSPRPIRFFHRGAVHEVSGAAPTRSVLDWLREDARCTGTKEGCNEGDCGACTVVIGELAAPGDAAAVRGLSLKTVNACIQFLPTLDGKALFSVEDLKGMNAGGLHPVRDDELHPVQRAMVECHGSQCGFCTPGFVMSLWSLYEHHPAGAARPSRQQIADELSGNLCRCTGYRPILDAGQRMFELPAVTLDTAPVIAALTRLKSAGALHYSAGGDSADPYHAPTTLAELAMLREQRPQALLLAGSTDVGLWVNKQFRALGEIIYLGAVDELKHVAEQDGELRIGAGASLETAWAALAQRFPTLTDVWLRFGSKPIRHAGTMGGNVANGSPIGDAAPVLMALDAQIELRRGTRVRRLPLD